MAANIQLTNELVELVKDYQNYLDNDLGTAKARLVQMIQSNTRRFMCDLNDLREWSRDIWLRLISHPLEQLPAFERALKSTVMSLYDGRHGDWQDEQFHVGLEGSIPQHEVTPRTLMAGSLGRVILLEGIVTRCSLSRPKVRKSVHYCEKTKSFHAKEYSDATMISGNEVAQSSVYPTTDADNNPLQTEFGLCRYSDFQTISIQEMPEKAPTGQLPRSVDVILHADLVDKLKPGDRTRIYGVFRSMGGVSSGANYTPSFRTIIIANNVVSLVKNVYQKPISDEEIEQIKMISKKKHVFELLSQSLGPSIYGNEMVKRAVLLQLLSGCEKNLENGTHIRGDINILMVGDPSTAKSQMLRFVLKMAPLAIATTGRGSSGVGLTAAVVSDKDTGERRLEAGAMVLADRGIVCIDEFDKMSDIDRVAIHEVMEQQTVTIAKAGIHTSLNARCSVLAAANPQFGQYDNSLSPAVNTALPDSLMSRFDLVFIILDQINPVQDRVLANHVLRMHAYIPPGLNEGEPVDDLMNTLCLEDSAAAEDEEDDGPFEKSHPLIASMGPGRRSGHQQILKVSFLKKYIHYAKSRIFPQLTEEACDYIGEKYVEFREKAAALSHDRQTKVFPVTARTLESVIRLSTAHAKARLSPLVEKKDAEAAVELAIFSIFRETVDSSKAAAPKKKKVKTSQSGANDGSDDSDGDESDPEVLPTSRRTSMRAAVSAIGGSSEIDASQISTSRRGSSRFEGMSESSGALNQLIDSSSNASSQLDDLATIASDNLMSRSKKSSQQSAVQPKLKLSESRFSEFCQVLSKVQRENCIATNSLGVPVLVQEAASQGFSNAEVQAAIERLQEENKLMLADEEIYFLG